MSKQTIKTTPTSVLVNGRPIRIKFRDQTDMEYCAGRFTSSQSLIEISKGQDAYEVQDTVLHEILHAILHTQGRINRMEEEEGYVRALATGLLGVFHSNPAFLTWLSPPERIANE